MIALAISPGGTNRQQSATTKMFALSSMQGPAPPSHRSYVSVYKSNGESTKRLLDKDTDRILFHATLSVTICTIPRVIRFDNKSTLQEKISVDKLAAVRNVWEKWVEILPKLHYPNEDVTVDGQLIEFRSRCPFKQYIASKPISVLHSAVGASKPSVCDENNFLQSVLGLVENGIGATSHLSFYVLSWILANHEYAHNYCPSSWQICSTVSKSFSYWFDDP
ncbi:DDE_Tnp_1_7 domain-containing protein [Nephila pilipes]|uniref:DDE_Tnp_1_7 domain-containing protein n=1 Tax=Nephila pilipes TaxID=299642 RepID=A0A8X6R010_NEPPI|nr:DDE_Tnp_1_7 domain-containing protein [Nephila pilipes]